MAKVNKWIYGYKIMVNYGQGWEYECFEENLNAARNQYKTYRLNCSYPIKVVEGREPNPAYVVKKDVSCKK